MSKELQDSKWDRFKSPPDEGSSYTFMKEMRLAGNSDPSSADIEEGAFYLVDFNKEKGEQDYEIPLGKSVECAILRDAMICTHWDNDLSSYTYDSTEFRSFNDTVVLFYRALENPTIVAALPYSHNRPGVPSIGGQNEKALKSELGLKIRYVLYVYIFSRDEVVRLYCSSTDHAGADASDKPLSFDAYAEDSFLGLVHKAKQIEPDSLFKFSCVLTGERHSKKIFPKKFAFGKSLTQKQLDTIFPHMEKLYTDIGERMWKKYAKARENTDISTLDPYSQKIVEMIDAGGTDSLLYRASDDTALLLEPDVKEGDVIDVAAVEEVFPPSEKKIKEHKEKEEKVRSVSSDS